MTDGEALGDALRTVWRTLLSPADARQLGNAIPGTQKLAAAFHGMEPDQAAGAVHRFLHELAQETNQVSVVATGLNWVGGGTRSVEQTLLSLIRQAKREIQITAYSVSSGSGLVTERLTSAAATGIRCVLVVNRLLDQPEDIRTWLEAIATRYPAAVAVYDFDNEATEGLHAKVVVIDRAAAVVGSANLTFHGMTLSHELGLLVRGPAAATIASAVDQLTSSTRVRRVY